MNRVLIRIKGVVQGVGFRPFVYNLAKSLNLKGYVSNTADGVVVDVEGEEVISFIDRLPKESPPLSEIKKIDIEVMPVHGYEDFAILKSSDSRGFTLVAPDVSICEDCLREMFDKNDRRYLYPFINCTNCGPRYTITNAVPYDRPNTTMASFRMCRDCETEYNDPANRRFHAQPNACQACGPHVELIVKSEKLKVDEIDNPIKEAIKLLKEGAVVAIKGLGGFHIACDATSAEAVEKLRERKRKSNKPFALVAPDIDTIEKYCEVSEHEKELLISGKRPIVILKKRADCKMPMPEAVSPNNRYLGFMLPYTPLHYLLFFYPSPLLRPPFPRGGQGDADSCQMSANFDALVMTSGNISEEPIVVDNSEAASKLSDIADAFLVHNRDIFMRTDDSVVRQGLGIGGFFIRRSRGYVPDPIVLSDEGPEVLACGADLKNTFTLTKGNYAIPSQHIGDMENYETVRFFEESLENLKKVYRVNPAAIAYDLHPNYLSTKWALSQVQKSEVGSQKSELKTNLQLSTLNSQLSFYGIQHHYAHVASVMAERGIKTKVIGVSFDGTGYGTDGNLWGGEFLIADLSDFKRAGHFRYIPLPGGEMAIKEPWRTAVSYIRHLAGDEAIDYLEQMDFTRRYGSDKIKDILRIAGNREFSPLSSGAGRLFDAISATLGICDENTFEGEAAAALESYAVEGISEDYPVDIIFRDEMEIDFSLTILRIIQDMMRGVGKEIIASKFHNTIVSVIGGVVQKISNLSKINDVILSGGVFQNMYILKNAVENLRSLGLNVHINVKVPCNDAGISLGQAYIARERMKAKGWEQKG